MKTSNRSNYLLGLLTGASIVTVGFFTGKALGLHSKPPKQPVQKECKQPTFQEMMSIITRYGMYVDMHNYGKTKEERKIAKDSVDVYQKRYNIGQ